MGDVVHFADLHLVRKIASGGMGEVWEARQTGPRGFEKRLAVKKILPHLTEDEDFVNMFLDEGRLVAYLDHPNICQIFRMGSFEGIYYMEMEYVEGIVLTELLDKIARRGAFLPIEYCCQIVLGLCAGLDYAHARVDESGHSLGIVHRDVSPPNVMLTTEGYTKLLDFGIAKARSRLQRTQPGLLKGKLGYVSPEQVKGEQIDGRSDIFSIGVVLWEMLTCQRLFSSEDEFLTLHMIRGGQYKPPSMYRENIPPELEWIVMKALSVRPSERFQTCGEFEQAIEDFLFSYGVPAGNRRLARFVNHLMEGLFIERTTPIPFANRTSDVGTQEESKTTVLDAQPTGSLQEQEEHAPTTQPNTPKQPVYRILVADDESEIRDVIRLILTAGGFEVEMTKDGQEAVDAVRKQLFDVCILDLDMPRLDGRGALEQIRKLQPSLPCIIQTANNSFHMATEMGRRGAVTYLLKPARKKALLQAVQEALKHRPTGKDFEPVWMYDLPTPLAELRIRYREVPERLDAAKKKHAMLAAQFELLVSWIGALSLACYHQDRAFCAQTNQLFVQNAQTIHPGLWLELFESVHKAYRRSGKFFAFRPIQDLFLPENWEDEASRQILRSMMECITPLLSEPMTEPGPLAWDAILVLATYHREMWRHDVMLDDRDVMQRVEVLDACLTAFFERMYRMIDFNLVRVDGLTALSEGIQHDLTVFRGSTLERQTYTHLHMLDTSDFYMFDQAQNPWVKISPFLISSPCTSERCRHSSVAFPVQLDPSRELLYRCLSCGLLSRPSILVERSAQALFQLVS